MTRNSETPTARRADLNNDADSAAVLTLLDAFAIDPTSEGKPLAAEVRERLLPGLRAFPTTLVWLAWDGETPIGIAVAFTGFSTFRAAPLVNVHDLYVVPAARGRGVGRALLAAIEEHGRETGCCLLTLEVFANNPAKRLYKAFGFKQSVYQEEVGAALFMKKEL